MNRLQQFFSKYRAVAVCLLLFFACFAPSTARADTIEDFKCDVKILPDSLLSVTEEISMRLDLEGKHGIFRQIPILKRDGEGRIYKSDFTVTECKIDGEPCPFDAEIGSDHITIRVGDANRALRSGLYKFTISYTATRQIGFFPDHDELYWNVTGDMWGCPIRHASCRVSLPNGQNFKAIEWYRGARGEKGYMQGGAKKGNTVATTAALRAGEGLTVCYSFDKGLVTEPEPYFGNMKVVEKIAFAFAVLSLLLATFLAFHIHSKKVPAVVIPIWDIRRDITPSIASYIKTGECRQGAVTADIIFLATKGYIKIKETEEKGLFFSSKKIITLECARPLDEVKCDATISPDLQALMADLFAEGATISLTKKNGEKFSDLFTSVKFRAESFLLGKVATKSLPCLLLLAVFAASLVAVLPFWGEDTESLVIIALACLVPCGVCYAVFRSIASVPRVRRWAAFGGIVSLLCLYGGALVFACAAIDECEVYFATLCAFMVTSLPVSALALKTSDYTAEGLADYEHVCGIELFLGMAEKERLEFFEARDKEFAAPNVQYERFLPYAVALGVAKTWAEKFAGQLRDISYTPTWYETTSPDLIDIMILDSCLKRLNSDMRQSVKAFSASRGDFSISGGSGFGGGGSW